ncbi:MAG: SPFH domain-containing protein [Methanomicrobiales archaeon]|nr:SPFH domain-containing protein [Methanomicrobiales archaeon]
MGLFDRAKSTGAGSDIKGTEARKLFYWVEEHKGENVIWRLPQNVMWNDNVVIREDEYGVFFRDGKAMQVFDRPDRYALTTQNITGLQTISAALVGVKQIGEFYWVQKRDFRSTFGTSEPLTFRDPEFGVIRLRAFGQFAYRVSNPMNLITQFVGTKGLTKSEEIVTWLKDQIVMVLNDVLGELKSNKQMSALDIPAYLQEIEQFCLGRLGTETDPYGLKVTKFSGLNINLPEEVQQAVDKRGAMSALGVNYLQYQTGKAIEGIGEGAAQGGEAGGFAGLGAGMGAGFSMAQGMAQGMSGAGGSPPAFGNSAGFGGQTPQQSAPQPGEGLIACISCKSMIPAGIKFCPECGAEQKPAETCKKCNGVLTPGAKFCPSCGAPVEERKKFCTGCGKELEEGQKFCPECGAKQE